MTSARQAKGFLDLFHPGPVRLSSQEAPEAALLDTNRVDASLSMTLGLLNGPCVLKQHGYGDDVLLNPKWLGAYGEGLVHRLRRVDLQLGSPPVGEITVADLPVVTESAAPASFSDAIAFAGATGAEPNQPEASLQPPATGHATLLAQLAEIPAATEPGCAQARASRSRQP